MKPRHSTHISFIVFFGKLKLVTKLLKSSSHLPERTASQNPEANAKPYSGWMPALSAIFKLIWAASKRFCFANSPTALSAPCKAPLLIVAEYKGQNDKTFPIISHFQNITYLYLRNAVVLRFCNVLSPNPEPFAILGECCRTCRLLNLYFNRYDCVRRLSIPVLNWSEFAVNVSWIKVNTYLLLTSSSRSVLKVTDPRFFPSIYGPHALRLGHISKGRNEDPSLSVWTEKTRLVRY